jgi:hypothetical protein
MADLKNVVVIGNGPIKSDAALHGKDIGYIWGGYGVELTVDYALLHDGWVPITHPNPWMESGQQGWIKWARCAIDEVNVTKLLVTVYDDGRAPTVKVIS